MSSQAAPTASEADTSDDDDGDVQNITDSDDATMALVRARLSGNGDAVCVERNGSRPEAATGVAPHHTVANRFDAGEAAPAQAG